MDKNELYEAIMDHVAKVVKKKICEYFDERPDNIISRTEEAIDQYVIELGRKALDIIASMTLEQQQKFMHADLYEKAWMYAFTRHGRLSLNLVESNIKNGYEAESTADLLKSTFDLSDFQVKVIDQFNLGIPNITVTRDAGTNHKEIAVIIPKIEKNLEEIREFMRLRGYTLIRRHVPYAEDFRQIYILFFTPIERIDVSEELQDGREYLYHMSNVDNRESIKKIGLIAKARYGLFDPEDEIEYPERVYLFTSLQLAEDTREDYSRQGMSCDLYKLSIKKLAERFKMYYDPLYGKEAVYIEQTVPPEFIEEIF